LKNSLKSELAIIIWMNGFENLTVIDFVDFYTEFKKFLERVYEFKLDDDIHRNKIEFYIDSSAEGKI